MRFSFLRAACSILLVIQGLACSAPSPGHGSTPGKHASGGNARSFLTEIDYLEAGRTSMEVFLASPTENWPPDLDAVIARGSAAVTRVRQVTSSRSFGTPFSREQNRQYAAGSGISILDGRRVITAAHAVDGEAGDPVEVVFADGRRRMARLGERVQRFVTLPDGSAREQDWALLDLDRSDEDPPPSVFLGAASVGELVIVLGYPGAGIDSLGNVVVDGGTARRSLRPIVLLGKLMDDPVVFVEPIAGSIPRQGMSGGPVLDARGGLVGIVSAVSHRTQEDGTVRYWIMMTPITDIPPHLLDLATEDEAPSASTRSGRP